MCQCWLHTRVSNLNAPLRARVPTAGSVTSSPANRLKAEVVLYTLRAHELPADWFSAPMLAQDAPNANERASTPSDLM